MTREEFNSIVKPALKSQVSLKIAESCQDISEQWNTLQADRATGTIQESDFQTDLIIITEMLAKLVNINEQIKQEKETGTM